MVKRAWPPFDLFAGGVPAGGPAQAALAYIFSDGDHAQGYRNGWSPGNPNFRTDQYTNVVLAAASMLDHPDARRWLAFGKACFDDDARRVLLPPDGVGLECPGYSTYSIQLQLELAKVFMNTGFGNPVAENPLFRLTGIWHRHLLTPFDRCIGIRPPGAYRRHPPLGCRTTASSSAPWPSSSQDRRSRLRRRDDGGVAALLATRACAAACSATSSTSIRRSRPAPLAALDWGSHRFLGFGAIMSSSFAADAAGAHETYATFR